jgi:hypothetical protein
MCRKKNFGVIKLKMMASCKLIIAFFEEENKDGHFCVGLRDLEGGTVYSGFVSPRKNPFLMKKTICISKEDYDDAKNAILYSFDQEKKENKEDKDNGLEVRLAYIQQIYHAAHLPLYFTSLFTRQELSQYESSKVALYFYGSKDTFSKHFSKVSALNKFALASKLNIDMKAIQIHPDSPWRSPCFFIDMSRIHLPEIVDISSQSCLATHFLLLLQKTTKYKEEKESDRKTLSETKEELWREYNQRCATFWLTCVTKSEKEKKKQQKSTLMRKQKISEMEQSINIEYQDFDSKEYQNVKKEIAKLKKELRNKQQVRKVEFQKIKNQLLEVIKQKKFSKRMETNFEKELNKFVLLN